MLRIILGVIVGFFVWSIVWVGGEAMLAKLSPDWLGAYSLAAEKALVNGTEFTHDPVIVAINLGRSFITSLIAGYMTALVAGEYRRSTLILGILLLLVGVAVEYFTWPVAPAWYHILFVIFLIPVTMVGGKLRRPS